MRKFKVLTMSAVLTITSLGLFQMEKANASVLEESVIDEVFLEELMIDSRVSSGSQTQSGITAKVYTDKNTYKSTEKILINGEKTAAGGIVHWEISLAKKKSDGTWVQVNDAHGNTNAKTPQVQFAFDGAGTYRVMMKLLSNGTSEGIWYGDWITTEFKVTN